MTTRAPGYYWLRAADGSAFIARLMPDAKLWMTAGDDVVVVDIDVLAGPLQAPETKPGAVRLTDADVRRMTTEVWWDPKQPTEQPQQDNREGPDALIADAVIDDGKPIRLGVSRAALRLRARALLDGTTPGPWIDVGRDSIEAGNGSTVVDCYLSADTRFVLGAHALLTQLAKEDV